MGANDNEHVPEASLLRLSRYHCWLGELRHASDGKRIRSREIAEALGVGEETVRRDMSYIHAGGRPGAGYDPEELYLALGEFLDLTESHPFVAVGNADILRGLTVTFPAADFGLRPAGYFSERPEDLGAQVDGLKVQALSDLPKQAQELGATIALVACEPGAVQEALEALHSAGIRGVLMLTPVLEPRYPEGMKITFFRMPCALKSLVSAGASGETAASPAPSCCGDDE